MITRALTIISILSIFILTKYIVWWWTEKADTEVWNYQPYCCRRCLGFWLPLGIYLSVWYVFHTPIVAIGGIVLTVLDTIAFIIHENKLYK